MVSKPSSYTEKQKKIFGRWLEGLGIGIVLGAIVTYLLTDWKYWYYMLAGVIILYCGTRLYENN